MYWETRHQQALTLFQQGKYEEGLKWAKYGLKFAEENFGKDHVNVATSLHTLAEFYRVMGQYAEAEPIYKRSLEIREKSLGLDHPKVAATLNSMALLYEAQGSPWQAEFYRNRAQTIMEGVSGLAQFDVTERPGKAAESYGSQGQRDKAEAYTKGVLEILKETIRQHSNIIKIILLLVGVGAFGLLAALAFRSKTGLPQRSSPSLAGRAVLALGLMIGFYLLAIAVAGGLLFIPYISWVVTGGVYIKLALFCIVSALVILGSIIPMPDEFIPPGPRLMPDKHPELFGILSEVSAATGQKMPSEVYLIPEFNAWVAERGGTMGFGSRRVMGLGLLLLERLKVSHLRAVLAHEFGHFHGGDTKLGPWVYKTRQAIGRTLEGLSGRMSIIRQPFIAYGNLFLRVTHAVSRRQEFAADELAACTVGSRALIEGLRVIHKEAGLFQDYWFGDVAPILDAGFKPPLAEGFRRFVSTPSVAETLSEYLDHELKEGEADPHDTHPTLRDRIEAAKELPTGDHPVQDLSAVSLLSNVEDVERSLLVFMAGKDSVRALKPIQWEEVGEQVYLPMWENTVRQHPDALAGVTPSSLPELTKDLSGFGQRLVAPGTEPLTPEKLSHYADSVLGSTVALALKGQGWELHAIPGEFYFQRDDLKVSPFTIIRGLASGELNAEDWLALCSDAGIEDLDLGASAIEEASASPEEARFLVLFHKAGELFQQGEYEEAMPVAKEVLKAAEQAFGPDHPSVANSLHNLAVLCHLQGRLEEAEPFHQRALAIREEALGLDHPLVANSFIALASLYQVQGRYDEAEPLYKRGLDILEKVTPGHQDLAVTLASMSELYQKMGRRDEAKRLRRRAKRILAGQ
jgi:Zn-dependent protease with chaperone function